MTPNQTAPATFPLPQGFTAERKEYLFQEIVKFYDLADRMLQAVQKKDVINRDIQLELVTPFITQVTNSANIISVFYTEVVNKGLQVTPELQDTMETAFRNIFYAYKEFIDGAEAKLLPKGSDNG